MGHIHEPGNETPLYRVFAVSHLQIGCNSGHGGVWPWAVLDGIRYSARRCPFHLNHGRRERQDGTVINAMTPGRYQLHLKSYIRVVGTIIITSSSICIKMRNSFHSQSTPKVVVSYHACWPLSVINNIIVYGVCSRHKRSYHDEGLATYIYRITWN